MGVFKNSKRWIWLAILLLLVLVIRVMGGFDQAERAIYDGFFKLRGGENPGQEIVVIAIDEPSIAKLGRLPWSRSMHARLLEKLDTARAVGIDLDFSVASRPAEDEQLALAIAEHGRVVLASQFSFERDPDGEVLQVFNPPLPELMSGALGLGFANIPTDADGVVRHVSVVDTNSFDQPFPSFGIAVALAALDLDPDDLELSKGLLKVGTKEVPVNSLYQSMPYFWGPRNTFKTYSFADVLEGKVPTATFKDKIVVVGATAAITKDEFLTPFSTSNLILSGNLPTPGVELHASITKSFLADLWLQKAPTLVNTLLLGIIGLSTMMVVSGRSPWVGLSGSLSLSAILAVVVYLVWRYSLTWLNLASPMVLIFIIYTVITAEDFIKTELGRRRTKAMLQRYVSPAVAEELLANPDSLTLGGRRQLVTIMFCDIRGFTAYSEGKKPEEVVERLNQYLTAMTEIIFKYQGTLDKYLGDGLMAIFGAPVSYDDHIVRAIRAAKEIQTRTRELNHQWEQVGEPALQVGVGINSGEVLVGNVGSPKRMDYTVIGEEVNLASRVEGLTKEFGKMIVISERTVELMKGRHKIDGSLEFLGQVQVKGFTVPIGVFTVVDKGREV